MKPERKQRPKSFFDLSDEERDKEVARFDRPIDLEKESRPLTVKERLLFEKMRGGRGRSVYLLPVDSKLLGKASLEARKRGMSLDQFIISGIRGMVAFGQR